MVIYNNKGMAEYSNQTMYLQCFQEQKFTELLACEQFIISSSTTVACQMSGGESELLL